MSSVVFQSHKIQLLAPAQEMSELMSAVTILDTVQPDWGFVLKLQTTVKRRFAKIPQSGKARPL